ncbi:MAG: alpha/beta fold hydrolase [Polyangiaceae bacterium]
MRIPIEGGHLVGHLTKAEGFARACLILVHGITGTGDDGYLRRTARLANRLGMDALRVALRGCGDSVNCGVAPIYHAGLTEDVKAAVSLMATRYQHVHVLGFSLGGQLALRALGEWGDDAPAQLSSCIAVSPPVSLAEAATYAEKPSARAYSQYILGRLKERYQRAKNLMGPRFTSNRVEGLRTIREFDGEVIAPYFGFKDALDYYQQSSADAVLGKIAVPTLIVHAADDPLVPSSPVARLVDRKLSNVRVVIPPRGGHVSFYQPSPARDASRFWAEQCAVELAAALS